MQQELHFVYHTFFFLEDRRPQQKREDNFRSIIIPSQKPEQEKDQTNKKRERKKKLRHILDIPEKNKYTHHAFTYLIRSEEKNAASTGTNTNNIPKMMMMMRDSIELRWQKNPSGL